MVKREIQTYNRLTARVIVTFDLLYCAEMSRKLIRKNTQSQLLRLGIVTIHH